MSNKQAQNAPLINQTAAPDASPVNQTNPVIANPPITLIPDMFEDIDKFNTLRRQLMFNSRNNEGEPYSMRPEYQPHSEYNGALVGAILRAFHFLKAEKMIPTKENIKNFLRYSDNPKDRKIDIEEALDHAIEHDEVVMQNLGDQCLYISKNAYLWDCVNPEGGHPNQYSEATWDEVRKFLSSLDGRTEIHLSDSRYKASLVLKNSCLRRLCLGRVIQNFNMVVAKGWIKIFGCGPILISVTLPRS